MARKYELLSEMYDKTTKTMTNPVVWRHFLESACRNYRLRFDEQLLVFAQRPDATAVLEIERWNKQFGRWVNRGANGIAVFEDVERNSQRLKYYFDRAKSNSERKPSVRAELERYKKQNRKLSEQERTKTPPQQVYKSKNGQTVHKQPRKTKSRKER